MPNTKPRKHRFLTKVSAKVPRKYQERITEDVDLLKDNGGYSHIIIKAIMREADKIRKEDFSSSLEALETPMK